MFLAKDSRNINFKDFPEKNLLRSWGKLDKSVAALAPSRLKVKVRNNKLEHSDITKLVYQVGRNLWYVSRKPQYKDVFWKTIEIP